MRGIMSPICPMIYLDKNKWITYPNVVEKLYTISEYGEITNQIKKASVAYRLDRYGYVTSTLRLNTGRYIDIKVHRLVAWEYCMYNRDINLQVNHIDGNKLNNHYSNLEWVTGEENTKHASMTNLLKNRKSGPELSDRDVHSICDLLQNTDMNYNDIIRYLNLNVTVHNIGRIKRGVAHKDIASKYDFSHRTSKFNDYPEKVDEMLPIGVGPNGNNIGWVKFL